MEEVNIEGAAQVSVSPNHVDLVAGLNDSEQPVLFDFPRSTPAGHTRHLSEDLSSLTINDLRRNDGDENRLNQCEGTGISSRGHTRHCSEDLSSLAINDLRVNKVEDCHNQREVKVISRQNSNERNIFKAAEIAERFIQAIDNRVLVDTAAPIESVKDAVNKFGGILDWKERRKRVQLELDKAHEDAPEYKRRAQAAEVDKNNVLQELCSTRRIIEGLKLNLEKVQTETLQAQQDSELAEIRFKEMQQGIARRESAALKAEIELAKERRATALADLQLVKEELEQHQQEYTSLIAQREYAESKARESDVASQEIEKTVEDLTLELISLKESLTSSQAVHIIAEEQRINVTLACQQEKANWENELKELGDEVQKLNDELSVNKELESMIEAASAMLLNVRGEFTAYVGEALPQVPCEAVEEERPMCTIRATLARTRKELEGMRTNMEKAKDEVKVLWNAAATLRGNVEKEKIDLAELRKKEHLASVSASSLREELHKLEFDLIMSQERIKAAQNPVELQQARKEAEQATTKARLARNEVGQVREETNRTKAEVNVALLRLEAASREILAVNASEEIARASACALQEYKQETEFEPFTDRRSCSTVTLSLQDYDALSKKVQDAEDLAKKRVIGAVDKIKAAKEAEVRSLDKLSQLTKQMDDRRIALRAAQEKANALQDGRVTMENELRKRRSSPPVAEISSQKNTTCSFNAAGTCSNPHTLLPRAGTMGTTAIVEAKPRKTFFPRSVLTMFMSSKKKTHLK